MKPKRESRYVEYIRRAYELAQQHIPAYRHRNSPQRYTQPQLVAVVLLGFYMNKSYRDMEELMLASDALCDVIGLEEVPHYSTLQRAYARLSMETLRQLNDALLQANEIQAEAISIDSTGFPLTQASLHYRSRRGRDYHKYLKGFFGVDIDSQFILTWRSEWGPQPDNPWLNRLRRAVHRHGRQDARHHALWILLADKGFEGQKARPHDLISPERGAQAIVRSDRVIRHAMVMMARLDGLMGQRWKVETVNSVIKRKSGDTIRSRKTRLQHREVGMKALAYNLHRWVLILRQLLFRWFATLQQSIFYYTKSEV